MSAAAPTSVRVALPRGYAIAVERIGPAAAPGGAGGLASAPGVALLHGFTGSAAAVRALARALAARWPVAVPELPGHHRSGWPPPGARFGFLEAAADLARAAARALGAPPAAWVGYSMGGRLALAVAACRLAPGTRAVVAIGASAGIADPAEREARRASDEALAAWAERAGLERFVERWLEHPIFATQRRLGEAHLARARAERRVHDVRGLAAALRALGPGAQPWLGEALARARVPVLLVVGERDAKFLAAARALARAAPSVEVAVVPGAGHAAHLEAPEATAGVVRAFLEKTIGGSAEARDPARSGSAGREHEEEEDRR